MRIRTTVCGSAPWLAVDPLLLNFPAGLPMNSLPASAGTGILMALITWSNSYSVGVKMLDSQHTVLFGILNDLHAAMMNGLAQKPTGDLLKKLVSYTRNHFSTEEAMMAKTNYPEFLHRQAHHRDLTRQVRQFMARYERGDSKVNIEPLRFLSDWLTKHIQREDKEYGPWLNQRGLC